MIVSPSFDPIHFGRKLIQQADGILIGAGAGMSVAAGLDFNDELVFAQMFPHLALLGIKNHYEMFKPQPKLSPEMKWAYHAVFVHHILKFTHQTQVYADLLKLLDVKNYFIQTSNLDGFFSKFGYDLKRIHHVHGLYSRMQCTDRCSPNVYESAPIIDGLFKNLSPDKSQILDSKLIPRCTECGSEMFFNILVEAWFNQAPYKKENEDYEEWLKSMQEKKLVILDLGSGFDTPQAIRWKLEKLAYQMKYAQFIRINSEDAQIHPILEGRSLSIQGKLEDILPQLIP